MGHRVKLFRLILPAIALAFLPLLASGCLGGGETTVTTEVTVTVTGTGPGSLQAEKGLYTTAINELTKTANQINTDYRALIDSYNSGQAKADELSAKADENWRTYEAMSSQITEMKVPPEYQDAQKLLISSFNKWQSAFEAYRDGFRDNDNNMLSKARDLDNQAVIEVNQAVNLISQVK